MTSGNGNNNSQHNGESKPAHQVIDKSHVLTHLIEGFVIQEGAEPFPVERPSFSVESLRRHTTDSKMDGLPTKELKAPQEPVLTCELCGRVDFAYIFKRSKRFCSTVCAKRYNVGCTKRMGLFPNRKTTLENLRRQKTINGAPRGPSLEPKKKAPPPARPSQGESSQCGELSGYKRPPSPPGPQGPPPPPGFLPSSPGQWDIQDVYQFISALPGCLDIAQEFRGQEIDGQALLLLQEEHLLGPLRLKLGPALKILAHISSLRGS